MSPFSWQCQNLCLLSLAFIINWKVVFSNESQIFPTNGIIKDHKFFHNWPSSGSLDKTLCYINGLNYEVLGEFFLGLEFFWPCVFFEMSKKPVYGGVIPFAKVKSHAFNFSFDHFNLI